RHGDPLAFTFAGPTMNRMPGRSLCIGRWRLDSDGSKCAATATAETVAGSVTEAASNASDLQLRAASSAKPAPGLVLCFAGRAKHKFVPVAPESSYRRACSDVDGRLRRRQIGGHVTI